MLILNDDILMTKVLMALTALKVYKYENITWKPLFRPFDFIFQSKKYSFILSIHLQQV